MNKSVYPQYDRINFVFEPIKKIFYTYKNIHKARALFPKFTEEVQGGQSKSKKKNL